MKQSTFYVAGMDCPTEEQLIRNRLARMESVEPYGRRRCPRVARTKSWDEQPIPTFRGALSGTDARRAQSGLGHATGLAAVSHLAVHHHARNRFDAVARRQLAALIGRAAFA